MQWGNRSDAQWMKLYDLATQYHAQHGDLNIPVAYITPGGQLLGKWIARQRNARNRPEKSNTRLTKERIALLDSIGMNWGTQDPWQYRYNLVLEYKREHGDININAKYKTQDGIWLGNWLYHQRRALLGQEPHSVLSEEQRNLLKELGLSDERVPTWDYAYAAAKSYVAEHGTLQMPATYRLSDGFLLGAWLTRQRTAYKNGTLSGQHRKALEELHINWTPTKGGAIRPPARRSKAQPIIAKQEPLGIPKQP